MKKTVGRVIAALLAVVLLFALGFFLLPLTETVRRIPVKGSADWMKKLPDDLLLSDILIPGTHDSATRYVQLPWFSKCQDLSISEQLEAGYRYLDIRLGDVEKGADYPPLMHGFTKCKTRPLGGTLTLDQMLADCYGFLNQHPSETILFAVKHEHEDAPAEKVQGQLLSFAAAREGSWLLTDTIPTLGEARGRLVLLRRWEDEAGLGPDAGIPCSGQTSGAGRIRASPPPRSRRAAIRSGCRIASNTTRTRSGPPSPRGCKRSAARATCC